MALTQKKLQDLKDASLAALLNEDAAAWKAKARQAYTATHGCIRAIRPDRVKPHPSSELESTTEFSNPLAKHDHDEN